MFKKRKQRRKQLVKTVANMFDLPDVSLKQISKKEIGIRKKSAKKILFARRWGVEFATPTWHFFRDVEREQEKIEKKNLEKKENFKITKLNP